jgi:hypothetical protein
MSFGFNAVTYSKVSVDGKDVTRFTRYDSLGDKYGPPVDFSGHFNHNEKTCLFSNDGKLFFMGLIDGRVLRFDLINKNWEVVTTTNQPISHMKLSFNGSTLLFASAKQFWVYNITTRQLVSPSIAPYINIHDAFFFNQYTDSHILLIDKYEKDSRDCYFLLVDINDSTRIINTIYSEKKDTATFTDFMVHGMDQPRWEHSLVSYTRVDDSSGVTGRYFCRILKNFSNLSTTDCFFQKNAPRELKLEHRNPIRFDTICASKHVDNVVELSYWRKVDDNGPKHAVHITNDTFKDVVYSHRVDAYISLSLRAPDASFVAYQINLENKSVKTLMFKGQRALAVAAVPFFEDFYINNETSTPHLHVVTSNGRVFITDGTKILTDLQLTETTRLVLKNNVFFYGKDFVQSVSREGEDEEDKDEKSDVFFMIYEATSSEAARSSMPLFQQDKYFSGILNFFKYTRVLVFKD